MSCGKNVIGSAVLGLCLGSMGSLLMLPSLARAGDSSAAAADTGSALDEVVVTAQRRAEDIQKVPVVVQAFGSQELQDRNVPSLMELERLDSALMVEQTGSSISPFIRGVGSVNAGASEFSSVAIYVDGVYIGEQTGSEFDLSNAEQVQVLEGPQGALYGRNAVGGAIVVTTHTPRAGDKFAADFSAGYGNYDAVDLRGSMSGSLGEHAAGYISASRQTHDGYVTNLNPSIPGGDNQDLNDRDSYVVNAALTIEPMDNLRFEFKGSHFNEEDRAGMGYQAVGLNIPVAGGLNGTQAYYAQTIEAFGVPAGAAVAAARGLLFSHQFGSTYDGERNGYQAGLLPGGGLPGEFNALRQDRGSLRVVYDLDHVELSSLTADTDSLNRIGIDFVTASPLSYPAALQGGSIGFSAHDRFRDFQQEFIANSVGTAIRWVAGLNYIETDGNNLLSADLPGGVSLVPGNNAWTVESKAAYAQANIPIVGPLSVTAGVRYTNEDFRIVDHLDPNNPTTLPGSVNEGTKYAPSSDTTYTGRLEYNIDHLLVYGGVTTGFKAATLNSNNPATAPVDPEKLTSYEVGAKWNPTAAIQINASAFDYVYRNIQVSYIDQASGATVLINGSGAKVTGFELQSRVAANSWLKFRGDLLLLHSYYEHDVVSPGGSLVLLPIGDKELAGAPKYVVGLGADATQSINTGKVTASVDARKNSGYYFDALNLTGSGGADDKGFTTVDLSVKYTPDTDHWWVALRGVNIFNAQYYQGGLVAAGILREASPATPALIELSAGVKF